MRLRSSPARICHPSSQRNCMPLTSMRLSPFHMMILSNLNPVTWHFSKYVWSLRCSSSIIIYLVIANKIKSVSNHHEQSTFNQCMHVLPIKCWSDRTILNQNNTVQVTVNIDKHWEWTCRTHHSNPPPKVHLEWETSIITRACSCLANVLHAHVPPQHNATSSASPLPIKWQPSYRLVEVPNSLGSS